MTQRISIDVAGTPAAQGSKKHVGGGVMVESSKKVTPWRQDVTAAAIAAIDAHEHFQTFTGPVRVHADYVFARPKHHYRTGRNAHLLRDNAPEFVGTKPDIEKVVRSTHDALTIAGIWRDDCLVAILHTTKTYGVRPGVHLTIEEVLP